MVPPTTRNPEQLPPKDCLRESRDRLGVQQARPGQTGAGTLPTKTEAVFRLGSWFSGRNTDIAAAGQTVALEVRAGLSKASRVRP